tara:strand:+ start:1202 stop:1489 length:288 start_codon:yes stop_codon:yes gene_type:complete
MNHKDYQEISKIIEEVVGKDTLVAVKLLEGIKYYIDNKLKNQPIEIISGDNTKKIMMNSRIKAIISESKNALNRYNKKLREEGAKYKKANCATNS